MTTASPETLDLEALLAPIDAEQPTGVDLRSDDLGLVDYHRAKDARKLARDAENAALLDEGYSGQAAPAWRSLLSVCTSILGTRSKDLQVAAWTLEALVRLESFAGLRDGFLLLHGLLERYWDELHPRFDAQEGWQDRMAPLVGLDGGDSEGALIAPIAMAPLVRSPDHGPLGAWHFDRARELERSSDPEAVQRRIEQGTIDQAALDLVLSATPAEELGRGVEDLKDCIAALARLSALLDERWGSEAPSLGHIRRALEATLESARYALKGHLSVDAIAPGEAGSAGEPRNGSPGSGHASGNGQVEAGGREAAFDAIQQAAAWFRRNEPHSPISFILEQAVRWGRLPLPELLQELIPDESARSFYHQLTGIRRPPSDG